MKLAQVLAERLNRATAPVTLILPDGGCCEAAAKGGPMYDPEVDEIFINTITPLLDRKVRTVPVHGNINDEVCQQAMADEVMRLMGKE